MNKIINVLTFLATLLMVVLAGLAVLSAFSEPFRTQSIVNSTFFTFFWIALVAIFLISLFFLGNPIRNPGRFLLFAGIICILIGGIAGSTDANILLKKYLNINKVHKGIMTLQRGQSQNIVLLENLEIQKSPRSGTTGQLPFSIRLTGFHVDFYEPGILYVESPQKQMWQIDAKEGTVKDLGPENGKIEILKVFKNLQRPIEDGKIVAKDEPLEGINPAVQIKYYTAAGSVITKYIFERIENPVQPEDKIFVSYKTRPIKAVFSDIEIVTNGSVAVSGAIEINKPFAYGGYNIYQFDFDGMAGQFSVLQVVSNTGLGIVYAGFGLLITGTFWKFWFQANTNKSRKSKI